MCTDARRASTSFAIAVLRRSIVANAAPASSRARKYSATVFGVDHNLRFDRHHPSKSSRSDRYAFHVFTATEPRKSFASSASSATSSATANSELTNPTPQPRARPLQRQPGGGGRRGGQERSEINPFVERILVRVRCREWRIPEPAENQEDECYCGSHRAIVFRVAWIAHETQGIGQARAPQRFAAGRFRRGETCAGELAVPGDSATKLRAPRINRQ